ncbi:SPASM domain-containing protein [uncultured Parasutterella sp.]|uniref:SPASM domain-containing protein n=1 Tax=uncultured Parasutterella sp. TaxID=1263098 RepID=UPI00272D42DC|nr:SPASM domain-containing protein [uncultured Parasutterella sp.]
MVKHVNLLIGSACNMKCGYCLQTNEQSPADHKADPVAFAHRLVKYLEGCRVERIAYWGGEPMLYWERIKALHSTLRGLGITPQQSTITTNGRALTDGYVEYANANPDIFTVVSWHDGEFTDEQLDLIFQLNQFSISMLVHHYQTDMWAARDLYYALGERYGRYPNTAVHFLRANDGCAKDYYMTQEDVDVFCSHLETVIEMARLGDQWALWQCSQLLYHRNTVRSRVGPMCVRDELLSVDLHGNTYACHHNYDASNITGNIFKKIIPIKAVAQLSPRLFFDSDECRQCEALEECRGGCYTSNTHEIDCYFARKRYRLYQTMEKLFK